MHNAKLIANRALKVTTACLPNRAGLRLNPLALCLFLCTSTGVHAQSAAPLPEAQAPAAAPAPHRVLFIGNSYTYYNDLPNLVAAFAARAQQPMVVQAETKGGARLSALWGLRTTQFALKEQAWNAVVLQEQSNFPLVSPERMASSMREIDTAARAVGARTVLYLTWSRQHQPGTQAAITAAYMSAAQSFGAVVAPVGPAWQIALELDPQIGLYAQDGSHPSLTGSYLAACTLFLVLFNPQPACPALELAGLSAANAHTARQAALQAVTALGTPSAR